MLRPKSAHAGVRPIPRTVVSRTAATTDVAMEMEARDRSDKTRATSPLTVAPDAIEIDTTGLSVDDVVRRVMEIVERKKQEVRSESEVEKVTSYFQILASSFIRFLVTHYCFLFLSL